MEIKKKGVNMENLENLLKGKSKVEALKILKELGLISNQAKKGNLTGIEDQQISELKAQIQELLKIFNSHLKKYGLFASMYVKKIK